MSAVLDLRRIAALEPLRLDDLGDVNQVEREAALANWRLRMVSEYCSGRVFAALAEQLERARCRAEHVEAVREMVEQERRHGELCARVVAAFGGEPVAELSELPDVPRHDDVSALEAALRNVISISCCSETVAVALVGSERELAVVPDLRDVLGQILSDEVNHARFGWKLLSELAGQLDDDVRRGLDAYLPVAFSHQIDFHAPFLEMNEVSERAMAVGAPDGPSNWAIFVNTIEEVTVPGLERFGLHARDAWKQAIALR